MNSKKLTAILICLFLLTGCHAATPGAVLPSVAAGSVTPSVTPLTVAPPSNVAGPLAIPVDISNDSETIYRENVHLFDYDRDAPLDIREVKVWQENGLTFTDITYASPAGGLVPATLIVPDGNGPFAGMIFQHGMPSNRQDIQSYAATVARLGAVVIAIDAPFARPANAGREALTMTDEDRTEQIQLIQDLRRAVDLLEARPDVDPERLAYLGRSYGAAMGSLLAGVETRLKAYVLVVGDCGLVHHLLDWEQQTGEASGLSEAAERRWIVLMWPIEPIHYVGHAAPAALLFENGTLDELVSIENAERCQAAGSEPKKVLWYAAGHDLPEGRIEAEVEWLQDYIDIEDMP